jgi:hypothetical protein
MYCCEICRAKVGPGIPMMKWVMYRHDPPLGRKQVDREVKVCTDCLDDLRNGVRLAVMLEEHGCGQTARYIPPTAAPVATIERLAAPPAQPKKFGAVAYVGRRGRKQ